jgi:hypothetical protein
VTDVKLLLWDFEDAPDQFRRPLPFACTNGWVAYVCAESSTEVVEVLVARWRLSGHTVLRYEVKGGGILLTGSSPVEDKRA